MKLLGAICALIPFLLIGLTIYSLVRLRRSTALVQELLPGRKASLCPRCQSAATGPSCPICNWPAAPNSKAPERALHALRAQIDALAAAGLLRAAEHERLVASVRVELEGLRSAQSTQQRESLPEVVPLPAPAPRPAPAPAHDNIVTALLVDEPTSPATRRAAEPVASPEVYELAPRPAIAPPVDLAAPNSVQPADVATRARRFEASLAAAPSIPSIASPPKRQARMADLLAAFMEERNVRWGELIGGMLIVGGSIALVISFWAQIASQPLLKFGLFNGIVAALFALGFYTDKKWKLPTTSRGVLMIATLLVPLNFLSIAAVTVQAQAIDPLMIAGELFSIVLFGGLVYWAGRTITPQNPLGLAVGVLGASVAQLAVRRWAPAETDLPWETLYLLCGWPLVCHAVAVAVDIWRLRRVRDLTEPQIHALLRLFGLTAFAALPACGMLLSLSTGAGETLSRLAPLVSLAGMPSLAAGLLLWRCLRDTQFTGLRTVGTTIAIFGGVVMVGAIALAWPDPALLVGVAAIDFVVLTLVAVAYELPAAHLLAAVAMALGSLVTLHVARGELAWTESSTAKTLGVLASAVSGNALAVLSGLYALAAIGWRLLKRPRDAACYFAAAGAITGVSLALVTLYGFRQVGDPFGATWVYALYAAGLLAATAFLSSKSTRTLADLPATAMSPPKLSQLAKITAIAGSLLVALALAQGLVYRAAESTSLAYPWTTAFIAHGLLVLGVAAVFRLQFRARIPAQAALETTALVTSGIAAGCVALDLLGQGATHINPVAGAWHAVLLALVWFAAAYLRRSSPLFTLAQASTFAAATLATIDVAMHADWWAAAPQPWLDPRGWQLLGCVWAILCSVWTLLRVGAKRLAPTEDPTGESTRHGWLNASSRMLHPAWPMPDHWVVGAVVIVLVSLATYAAWPGAAQELATRSSVARMAAKSPPLVTVVDASRMVPAATLFEIEQIPHAPAWAAASWWLLGLAALALVAGLWERRNGWRLLGLLIVMAAICPLLAARYEPEVAVASALRWFSAGFFLVGSIGVWSRDRLATWGQKLGWRQDVASTTTSQSPGAAIAALALLAVAPLGAMAGYVVFAALATAPIDDSSLELSLVLGVIWVLTTGLAVAVVLAGRLSRSARLANAPNWNAWANPAGVLLLVLGAAPLLAMLIYLVGARLAGDPIVGPEPGSWFVQIGLAANYSLPAALVALVLVGYALRERSADFAFVAGLVTNLTATVGYLFTAGSKFTPQDPELWMQLGLLNSLVAALFGIGWHGATRWSARRAVSRLPLAPLEVGQAALAVVLLLLVLSAASFVLVIEAQAPPAWIADAASALGLSASATAWGLALWMSIGRSRMATTALASAGLWSLGALAGSWAVPWDRGDWLALHVLQVARLAAPWAMLAGAWWVYRREILALDDRPRRAASLWASLLALPALVVSLRMVGSTAAQEPWWSSAGVLSLALLAVGLSIWSCRRMFLYAASALGVLTAAIWFPRSVFWPGGSFDVELYAFVDALLTALALPVVVWLSVELRWIRPQLDRLLAPRIVPVHRTATWLAVLGLGLVAATGIATDYDGFGHTTTSGLNWLAVLATASAAIACLWDDRARESVAVLYLFGLVLVGVFLDSLDLSGDRLLWTGVITLGAFNLASSYLWSRRAGLRTFARSLGMPVTTADRVEGHVWIRSLTTLLVAIVVALVYWVVMYCPERELKISAGFAAIFQAFALGMLAQGERRAHLQRDALLVGLLGAVAFSWAFVTLDAPHPVLNRSVATCVALGVTAIFYALGIARLPLQTTDWVAAAQRIAPLAVTAMLVTVAAVLGQEVLYYLNEGVVPLPWPGILAVALTLLTIFAATLAAALLPGRDPFGLSERGRMLYVYAAEVLLALLFLHVRITMPWLFRGVFLAYWPLVVMAIAYLGVGLAEWFGRRQQRVLAEPLERTGVLLPLLPVIGFWFVQSQTNYSLLLLVVGGLYTALAVTRKSIGFGLLAALCANGGLWHYLHQAGGIGFLEHPQLWLIPPALCVLAAAYLNRERLNDNQMTTVRYLTSMTIYLSSTADIFLQGVAQAPWLPVVLAALAIAGVFAGIILRVRAFLFLGTSFLTLSILTMIWHAAVDLNQTWIWWATLIVAGVAIIVLFAVFEKRRQDVLRVVEELKQWEG